MKFIDINCDMGENFGSDSDIVKFISSANIACGGHAGDKETMQRTALLALENNVLTGAHPGYPDRTNFGRTETVMSNQEIFESFTEQVGRLKIIINSVGSELSHIKLHGALYNRAAADYDLMYQITKIIIAVFGNIPVFTLAGSISEKAVQEAGGKFFSEGFADRSYNENGSLVPRTEIGAVLSNEEIIAKRVLGMVKEGKVESISGRLIKLSVQTVCVHSDTPGALIMASNIYKILKKNNIEIRRKDGI